MTSSTVDPATVSLDVPATSRARANRRRVATHQSVPALPSLVVPQQVAMTNTRVLILRHGQSEWNALGRWQGQANPPLTSLGIQQATDAAGLLGTQCPHFDLVITSKLERAHLTGQTIAQILGVPTVHVDNRWQENDAGEWQGLTPDEIRVQWPGYLESGRRPPHFETEESTNQRVVAALDAIVQENRGKCILVISHGGVLRLLRAHLGGQDQRFPNLSGSWFEHNKSSGWHLGSLLYPLQLIADDLRNNGAVE